MIGPVKPAGLALTQETKPGDQSDLAKACEGFEAIFLRQILSTSRNSAFKSDLLGSEATDTFMQMRDETFADVAAERGTLGISKMLEAQLSRTTGQE